MASTSAITEILVWIYEDHKRLNIEDSPFGSGDMDSLQEGLDDLIESLFDYKEKKNQYFDIDIVCDVTEEGAGVIKCIDAKTGDPRPFPEKWLAENLNKNHVLNDPKTMDPILKLYANPWTCKVEAIFTGKNSPVPPFRNLDQTSLEKFKQQEETLLIETMIELGINPENKKSKIILTQFAQKIRDMQETAL